MGKIIIFLFSFFFGWSDFGREDFVEGILSGNRVQQLVFYNDKWSGQLAATS